MSARNPDLPILDELGAEYAALVAAEFGETGERGRARLPSREQRTRPRQRQAHRVARRSSLVFVLLCLVGGVALAARFGGAEEPPANTSPTLLGKDDARGWNLSAYRDRGRLCLLLSIPSSPASDCGTVPPPKRAQASSVVDGDSRYVFGLAGPGVDSVAVLIGDRRRRVMTRAPADPDAARAAGVPDDLRWFAIPFVGPATASLPARVTPLAAGEPAGRAYLDCSLGIGDPACERRIRSQAARLAD